jgi:hypothetical protein
MSLLRGLAILCVSTMAAVSGAGAQTSIPLTVGQNFSLEGINLKIASCTGTGGASCAGAELLSVSSSRGVISFEIIGTGGGSAALSESSASSTSDVLTVGITVADTSNSSRQVTSASASTVGTYNLGSCSSTPCSTTPIAQGAATLSVATGGTPLLDQLSSSKTTQQTVPSGPLTVSTPSTSSMTLTETLTLNDEKLNVSTFNIYSQLITLHATPEPATLSIMLLGLGGLAVARRRRRS